jgi:G:T-mismatch repair DNA endonuclease (very short patch repair protein)
MELPNLPKAKNRMQFIQRNTFRDEDEIRRIIRYVQKIGVYHECEMNSKEITNIRKRIWQMNGKTDGMGTR